jgi:hypothetical protein
MPNPADLVTEHFFLAPWPGSLAALLAGVLAIITGLTLGLQRQLAPSITLIAGVAVTMFVSAYYAFVADKLDILVAINQATPVQHEQFDFSSLVAISTGFTGSALFLVAYALTTNRQKWMTGLLVTGTLLSLTTMADIRYSVDFSDEAALAVIVCWGAAIFAALLTALVWAVPLLRKGLATSEVRCDRSMFIHRNDR